MCLEINEPHMKHCAIVACTSEMAIKLSLFEDFAFDKAILGISNRFATRNDNTSFI